MRDLVADAWMRRSFPKFCTGMVPGYQLPEHITQLAGLLEAIERRDIRKLLVAISVRFGKSWALQLWVAWYLGRNPTHNVIFASHSQELSDRNSRMTKAFILDDRWPFGTVKLSPDSTSVSRWDLRNGGGAFSVGVGGSCTGRSANALVIDDALADGLSEHDQQSVYTWFTEVAIPRLEPNGIVIVAGARFAVGDLYGSIANSDDGPNYHKLTLAAIRPDGTSLWPDRYTRAELDAQRLSMREHAFECQFQQNPSPRGGNLIKTAWLERRYRDEDLPQMKRACVYLDSASKTGTGNDFSALVHVSTDGQDFYIRDVLAGKWEFAALKAHTIAFWQRATARVPITSALCCESASSGIALSQEIKRTTSIPIVPVVATLPKLVRLEASGALYEAGRVLFPTEAPWLSSTLSVLSKVPSGADDVPDALAGALARLVASANSFAFAIGSNSAGGLGTVRRSPQYPVLHLPHNRTPDVRPHPPRETSWQQRSA
jgi:predicted phage terminase large subunit-like protein